MPNWTGGIITAKGRELQAKVEAGETLVITKMKLGSGTPQAYEMDTLTDLKQPLMEFGISSKTVENNICEVTGVVVSSEIETPFYAREWGLFAQDPDEGEILYMYTTDPNPDFIPAKTAALQISATYALNIVVLNVDNIIVNIDPNGLVTTAILNSELKEYLPLSGGNMTGDITANNVYANNNVLVFNNIAEMKSSNKVKVGYTLRTLGFYTAGDGGGADYLITDNIGEDEADEASIIALQKGLYAKLLIQEVLNVKQLGAYGDGIHDDTSTINKAFDILKNIMIEGNADLVGGKYYTAPTLYIPFGIYKVTDTITFYMGANSVKGDGATLLFEDSVENAVKISSVYLFGSSSGYLYHTICTCKIEGLRLICNSPSDRGVDSVGILFGGNANVPKNMLTFENLYITGFKTTLKWGSDTWNVVFIKCSFFGGNINVHFPKNMTNAWERCDFYSCTFCGSKEYAILSEFPYGQINFTNCSFDYHLGVVIRLTYGCRCYLNGCWIEWTVKINKNYIAELIDGENSILASLFILNTTIVPMYKDSSNINDDEVYEHGLFYSNIRTLTTSENNKVDMLSSIYIENTTMSAFEAPEIITGGGDIQLKNIVGGDFIGFVPKKIKEDVYNLNTIPFIPYGLRTDQTDAYTVNLSEGILSINVINKDEIINKRPIFMLNVKDTEFFTLDLSLKGNKSINFDVIINRGYGYVNPSTGEFVKISTYKYSPYIRTEINESVSTGAYVNFKTDMWYEEARLTDKCPFPLMVFFEFDFSKANENANGFILSFDKAEIRRRVPL